MCKYLNGGSCECEFTNNNVCNDPSNCEYMEDDSMEDLGIELTEWFE